MNPASDNAPPLDHYRDADRRIFGIPLPYLIVFFTLLISFGWFAHSNPGWNANSRLALAVAWATTGRPQVDDLITPGNFETLDLATYKGALYSDKSIGASLLGVPAAWLVEKIQASRGETFPLLLRAYLITVMSISISGAVAGALLMRWLHLLWGPQGVSRRACAFLALAVMLGTMLFHYSTLFFSYTPATMALLAMLITIEKAIAAPREPGVRRNFARLAFLAGIFGGLTILCEYFYAAGVGLAGLYLMARIPRSWFRVGLLFGAGCFLGNLPFLVYSLMIFGKPSIPYEHHVVPQFRAAMAVGLMGAVWPPKMAVLYLVTFHPFRGLFVYSPQLTLGLAGLLGMLARRHQPGLRALGLLCLATVTFYVLFNGCYYMWWGGWSFSPRLLAPAVPFLAAGLGSFALKSWGRIFLAATAAVGVAIHLMVVATDPQVPDGGWNTALMAPDLKTYPYPNPLTQMVWPWVVRGELDWNLGAAMGLKKWATLLPLLVIWALAGAVLIRAGAPAKSAERTL